MPTFSAPLQAGGQTPAEAPRPAAGKAKNAQKMALFQTKNALATVIRQKSSTAMDVKQVNAEMKRLLHKTYYGPKARGKAPTLSYHQALERALEELRVGGGGGSTKDAPPPAKAKATPAKAKATPAKAKATPAKATPAKAKATPAKAAHEADSGQASPSKVLSTVVPVHTRLVQSVDLEFR